jgi:hypothetical protein
LRHQVPRRETQHAADAAPDTVYTRAECEYMEPNETLATAAMLGSGDTGPAAICPPASGSAEDRDFYKFTATGTLSPRAHRCTRCGTNATRSSPSYERASGTICVARPSRRSFVISRRASPSICAARVARWFPFPQSRIDARTKEFENKIDAARQGCAALGQKESATTQRWVESIKALEAKRGDVRRRQQEALDTARVDLTTLERNGRKLVERIRAKHEEADRALATRKEELKAKRAELDKTHAQGKSKLLSDLQKSEQDRAEKVRVLLDRIAKLRSELTVLSNNITNAHHQKLHLGVSIDVTFAP